MDICVNAQSYGLARVNRIYVNDSGTWRIMNGGYINVSGTWREFKKPYCSCLGGYLICSAASVRWIVSPYSAEVIRDWYNINDANTRAQAVSGCTGWFVPTLPQLINPGFVCRCIWGPYPCWSTATCYWSSTEESSVYACAYAFVNESGTGFNWLEYKSVTARVRAFRCVTY
jgi:hypothetical protein